jgi:hypothetical protein
VNGPTMSPVAASLADGVSWPVDPESIRSRRSDKLTASLPAITRLVAQLAERRAEISSG